MILELLYLFFFFFISATFEKTFSSASNTSGLPKVIFLAVAEAEGEGGKTSALEVKGEA